MQDFVGENRHQHGVGHSDQAHQTDQEEERADDFCPVDPAEAFDDVFNWGTVADARDAVHLHQQQADKHGDVAQ